MNDITQPLRLAVGSHPAGSGRGCTMNLISWENGDSTITDFPACSDRMLARVVQRVNDSICSHRQGDLLCPRCSIKVLKLGHRTVGTGSEVSSTRVRVWVTLAVEEAESVLPIFEARRPGDTRPRNCIETVRRWLAGQATIEDVRKSRAYANADAGYAADADAYAAADAAAYADAAYADADAYAYAAADAAANAAAAYADADAYAAADAAANADAAYADADADAAYAAARLRRAHHIIDRFYELSGLTEGTTPDESVVADAVRKMLVGRAAR